MAGAETERIVQQVKKCPSRALEFEWLNEQAAQVSEKQIVEESKDDLTANGNVPVIICEPHGPLVINGIIRIKHSDGRETTEENVRLCSCGSSKKKPYCDGSHETDGFSE